MWSQAPFPHSQRVHRAPIEVSTDFTIGGALEDAAAELGTFWEAQAPCNEVTLEGPTVHVDWGELEDGCTYNGHTYAGKTTITVERTQRAELEVLHEWFDFHNETIAVDGSALVTWDADALTRHVTTDHTWTDAEDDAQVHVTGEHEFGVIGGLGDGGYTLAGKRDWTTEDGTWHLDMVDIDFRLQDPVPEAGTYTVRNPAGQQVELTFERLDEDTIEAVLHGVRGGDIVYHVGAFGQMEHVR